MSKQRDLTWEAASSGPGSYEWHNKHMFASQGPGSSRKHTHIVSPSIGFKTDDPLFETFVKMLEILEKIDFFWVCSYSGPSIPFRIPAEEAVHVDSLYDALDLYSGRTPIPQSGFKARLIYDHDRNVTAHLKVGGFFRTKVKLRVRGTMKMSDWKEFHRKTGKRYGL